MARTRRPPTSFPGKPEIIGFIRGSPRPVGKREIARAFGLDSHQQRALTEVLRELERDGLVPVRRPRGAAAPSALPAVAVVEVTGIDIDGELLARPVGWPEGEGAPTIYMAPERRGHPALAPGERVLARLRRTAAGVYEGQTIRRIGGAPELVLGVYALEGGQGRLRPTDRRQKSELVIARADAMGARVGELVQAEVRPTRRLGLRQARVIERLGAVDHPRAVSLIAVHDHDIPTAFSAEALALAAAAGPATAEDREDLRSLPLVTIDDADARDFDDAVWAEADPDPHNPGGWHLAVAIADVGWYVRPGDALDRAACERGNSVYFPDRVVPMLPEALSNGWCSLKPGEERPCLVAHLRIDAEGELRHHRFRRALMRSAARLTYQGVQAAHDGAADPTTAPLKDTLVEPLFAAYRALAKARRKRGTLELEVPERRIVLADDGTVLGVEPRVRHDSHRLIEEFMIAANVAAAETLERLRQPAMYRVHDAPAAAKLEAFREFLDGLDLRLARGQAIRPSHFNRILEKVRGTPYAPLVHQVVLRTQAQAEYAPTNIGHFGLALRRYCHFTSPIRRYADLLVHRALIRGMRLGAGGLETDPPDFRGLGEHISMTERRAAAAERDTVDRFTAAFLAEKVGATFTGRITGVTRFGLFVTLDESGGDGLVPVRSLPADHYLHDETHHQLRGRRSGRTYRLGETVEVRLGEADPLTGGLILWLLEGPARRPAGRRERARFG